MIVIRTYFKNSNTGELYSRTRYTETRIEFPEHFYDIHGNDVEDVDLTGFVEISEKKFKRERRKQLK